jgi:hypothetical protein
MLRDPIQVFSFGIFPMAFSTIINMIVYVCVPVWGNWVITLAWIMWWFDVGISFAICFLAFQMFVTPIPYNHPV